MHYGTPPPCSNTDGMEVRSVGNSQTLKETALIEAFNLKAAIEYNMKNFDAAKEALTDMPPRMEEELDAVRAQGVGGRGLCVCVCGGGGGARAVCVCVCWERCGPREGGRDEMANVD